jgi:hypothetical protein
MARGLFWYAGEAAIVSCFDLLETTASRVWFHLSNTFQVWHVVQLTKIMKLEGAIDE